MAVDDARPLIAHIMYSFKIGGLENGVVNLLNHMPADRYRHAVICLTQYSDFRFRVRRDDVSYHALNKPAGHGLGTHCRLHALLRSLKPQIVHTRNLAAVECAAPAWLAGVPVRIHGEHGREVGDLDGSNRKYQLLRKVLKPFVSQYIALSRDLERYLRDQIGVGPARITQIYNGVDSEKFRPAIGQREALAGFGADGSDTFVIGTVGRMQEVKDQITLARAFVRMVQDHPEARLVARLVMVGDGPLKAKVEQILDEAAMAQLAWLPGARDDVAELMRGFDLFVLPSLAEGISNTILEAMSSGLPILATAVGGNPELVVEGESGELLPTADPQAMAAGLWRYLGERDRARRHGAAGRKIIEQRYSMRAMVEAYMGVYERALTRSGWARPHPNGARISL